MVDVKELVKKARSFKEKGLSEREIADELHLSVDSVKYLVEQGEDGALPPTDVKIGWRSIGVYGSRISLMSEILADIIEEELVTSGKDIDSVLGIALNGIPFATYISEILRDGTCCLQTTGRERKERRLLFIELRFGQGQEGGLGGRCGDDRGDGRGGHQGRERSRGNAGPRGGPC